jgi:16S rRNA (adenine1518-N6/adenine1519-N6)-dimethyltransferase
MAEASGCHDIGVLEIGPGIGVLTAELAKRAKKVVALEIDERLRPILKETLKDFDNAEVIFGDVLKLDLEKITKEAFGDMDFVVCANLPYYITSPIIMHLLESGLKFKSITVMVQKEAAERICAKVGSRAAGAVTVAVNFYSEPEVVRQVSRGSFLPPPNVDSTVIKLNLRDNPKVSPIDTKFFFRTVRSGFEQRRKTLVNSVSAVLGLPKSVVFEALEMSGLKPTARAEELSMEDFSRFSDRLFELKTKE